jgi:hypothetical protein
MDFLNTTGLFGRNFAKGYRRSAGSYALGHDAVEQHF